MAAKRKRVHSDQMKTSKRLRAEAETTNATMSDNRLTNLPEDLQFKILSFLETKDAMSKPWLCAWMPVLSFSSYSFKPLRKFDEFVYKALSHREPVKLDKLSFRRKGICSAKILNKVFDYAFSHGARELQVNIESSRKDKGWPIGLRKSSDTLTCLRLESYNSTSCPFLGPGSGSFKNLTNLHLKGVIISDLDPFSGFPALKKLALVYCPLKTTDGKVLNVRAPQLSELTIMYDYGQNVDRCELTTPKLRYFEFQGVNFPRLELHKGGLPNLDIVVIDFNGICHKDKEKMMFEDLLALFTSLHNAKSLTVFSSIIHLLSLFPDELVNRNSPFRDLKSLKLDFSFFNDQKLFDGPCRSLSESLQFVPGLKAYLLKISRDAKCDMIYPRYPNPKPPCLRSDIHIRTCGCLQKNFIKLTGECPW